MRARDGDYLWYGHGRCQEVSNKVDCEGSSGSCRRYASDEDVEHRVEVANNVDLCRMIHHGHYVLGFPDFGSS